MVNKFEGLPLFSNYQTCLDLIRATKTDNLIITLEVKDKTEMGFELFSCINGFIFDESVIVTKG